MKKNKMINFLISKASIMILIVFIIVTLVNTLLHNQNRLTDIVGLIGFIVVLMIVIIAKKFGSKK